MCVSLAKGLIVELTPLYAQSAWGSEGKRVRAAGLVVCCNYVRVINVHLSIPHIGYAI